MTPFEKELKQYLQAHGDAQDDWEAIQSRVSSPDSLLDTPYGSASPPAPPRHRGRLIAWAAGVAAAVIVAAGSVFALYLAARPPVPPVVPGGAVSESAVSVPPGSTGDREVDVVAQEVVEGPVFMRFEWYDAADNQLYVRLYNGSDFDCTFGYDYKLYRGENGGWQACTPEEGWAVRDLAVLLGAWEEVPHSFELDGYFPDGLMPGSYRLEMEVWPQKEGEATLLVPLEFRVVYKDQQTTSSRSDSQPTQTVQTQTTDTVQVQPGASSTTTMMGGLPFTTTTAGMEGPQQDPSYPVSTTTFWTPPDYTTPGPTSRPDHLNQTTSPGLQVYPRNIYSDDPVKIWFERYDRAENTLYVRLYNDREDDYCFGTEYQLYRQVDGNEHAVQKVEGWAVPNVVYSLHAGASMPFSFDLDAYYPGGIEPGDYRILMNVWPEGEEDQTVVPFEFWVVAPEP